LREQLHTPAPIGTVIALHHPPLPSPTPLTAAIELLNPADLAAAIRDSDVRVVLAGHTHVVSAGCLAGVPVWTGGAIATTLDSLAPGAAPRGQQPNDQPYRPVRRWCCGHQRSHRVAHPD
jgi:3',5'-cyclic AMP phosphodiesterase CpdA